MKQLNNKSNAFTLVEMLVVLGMISILMGVTFTGIGKAKTQAKIVKANTEVRELMKAWLSYETAYDDWPAPVTGVLDADESNLKVLLGDNDTDTVYLNVDLLNGAFRDPWGTPYRFRVMEDDGGTQVSDHFDAAVTFPNRNRKMRFAN